MQEQGQGAEAPVRLELALGADECQHMQATTPLTSYWLCG
ncbi:hypothetical protein SynA1524_00540 [Synechococcus sp. A15-24]|nr:hypothetical protein SynA1524_00540 [Synechococcus sp. A15-24]